MRRLTRILKALARVRHALKILLWRPFVVERGTIPTTAKRSWLRELANHDDKYRDIYKNSKSIANKRSVNELCLPCPQFVYEINNARLVGSYAAPVTESCRIITEQSYGSKVTTLTLSPGRIVRYRLSKPDVTFESVFSINSPYSHNFYHWFTDCLPQLRLYEELKSDMELDPLLFVPGYLSSWQRRSLQLLGYGETDFTPCRWTNVAIRRLYVPSFPKYFADDLPMQPHLFDWLKSRICSSVDVSRPSLGKRVFIRRKDTSKPDRIGNESELESYFVDRGYMSVVISDYTLDEQVAIFKGAEKIAASHGAGLTNLIYASKPMVFEFLPAGRARRDYREITRLAGGEYHPIVADRSDGRSRVRIDQLESMIDLIE